YYCDPDGHSEYVQTKKKLPVDDRTPYLGDFYFKNISCENVNVAAGTFYGIPEAPIHSITLENVCFKYADNPKEGIAAMMDGLDPLVGEGIHFNYVEHVKIHNVQFDGLKKEKYIKNFVNDFKEV
ncbi:MAG: hypothetical protein K2K50_00720, partial [Anaeroplasmataceae bacterium]|nr:hypothetical protein [Anaeroplasmataceae bacterium]